MQVKEVWGALLRAAECSAKQAGSGAETAVEDTVAGVLLRYPHLSSEETTFVRNCAFNLSRFAALCEGAFQGYRDCYKRNSTYRPSMYLVAYLLIFQYRALGGATVREMFESSMPTPRLCEFVEFLLFSESVSRYAVPLWRAVYDDSFIQRHVLASLSSVADDATHDVLEWFHRQPSKSGTAVACPATEETAALDSTHLTLPPSSSAVPLRPLAGSRLPPNEVREMVFTVPEPRLPRIKSSPAPANAPLKREPTTPVGFSFHQREAAVSAAHSEKAAECSTSADQNTAQGGARLPPAQLRTMLSTSKSVPTTVAALWRERRAQERQRDNAERALRELEVTVHDSTEFDLWRQAQLEEEERRRQMEVLRRHLCAIEASDRARAQREQTMQARRRQIQRMRVQYHAEMQANRREQEHALREHEEHVQQLRSNLSRNCAAAVEKVAAEKCALAAQVKDESEQLRAAAQEAEEHRRTHQVLLIQEIHLLRERLREKHAAMGTERRRAWADGEVDAALGRMSQAELRDALERLCEEVATAEESRRQRVAEVRSRTQEKHERLERECIREREKKRRIRQANLAQRMAHRAAVEAERIQVETARMAQFHEKLETRLQAKRDAHRAAHETERQRRNEVLLCAQDGVSMERKRWSQYEAGLVRCAEGEQLRVLKEAQHLA
ncbi:conserved hypothetical protein [Leishmania mexicana MHOM/GT/2001/U1103]|uniref:Uncharacterized protein n=1 Tax=Leishmania mexicana (strain MHOM/GT/2001/U1103) TaxID=929439 RepID=E9B5P4_LEIMU|nr:conserved hypothetical protein [Leishmania mexicana MHOM/GT/2001/U1103]CBZ30564.1 conserved hypothetical protein [Leishmania mexicana MHOM/GT/2001/U1103]